MRKGSNHAILAMLAVIGLGVLSPGAVGATDEVAETDGVSATSPTQGLASPEEAVHEYLAGVAGADFDRVLNVTAIDEMAEGYRFDLAIDRLSAFMPFSMMAPSEYPFYADMNRVMQANRVMFQMRNLSYSLLSGVDVGQPMVPADIAWARAFTDQLDPTRLRALTVVDVRVAEQELLESSRAQEALALQARASGADEVTERVALISFDGDMYWVGLTLGRYGNGWKVQQQTAAIAGSDSSGSANPTTLDEFDELTRTE
jgi:hypothetical protein